jgi:[ribosomal protein S18]-alanine N-acetyltransferase
MEGLTIRPLAAGDGAAIERITRSSPEAANWPAETYAELSGWVAETSAGVIGFIAARAVAGEMEVLNLAVDPVGRRSGAGRALLDAALDAGRNAGARRAYLEVRESNRAARRFYERRGFAMIGERPRYYSDPEEDAILMARDLLSSE